MDSLKSLEIKIEDIVNYLKSYRIYLMIYNIKKEK
jgi:hypothetical protein